MKRIEFHDREQEAEEIRDIPGTEPSLITFVYGPLNSGKTALINHLVDRLPEDYKVFYINLRGRFISDYDDFVKVLFDVEHVARREEKPGEMLRIRRGQIDQRIGVLNDVRITPDVTYLVKENILFADLANSIIKPQSRLDLFCDTRNAAQG